MAQEKETLEMRVAALEDKLAKMNVTEEEMRAFEKVSALMGGGAPQMGTGGGGDVSLTPHPDNCFVCQIYRYRGWPIARGNPIVRFNCANECQPIFRGVCDPGPFGGGGGGGGMAGGSGFGGFGF